MAITVASSSRLKGLVSSVGGWLLLGTIVLWCSPGGLINTKKGKSSFYIAQYPVRRTAQSAIHFLPSLADLFIPTPLGFSGKLSSLSAITRND